jgi:UDP-N-acetylglucosamine 2-epimerase (non-hydrolysing)
MTAGKRTTKAAKRRRPSTGGRVAVVFGTRPEATKMAPVILALRRRRIPTDVVVTAQHRELLDQVLALFRIEPDVDLDIMRPGQSLTDVAVRTLRGVGRALGRLAPELVLVHGDTSTTLYATLAAFYARVPVGHVEAGLRTHDLGEPFPEEANRLLTDQIADLLFAPTEGARRNLLREGRPEERIFVTGNTAVDAIRLVAPPRRPREVPLVLVECHRRENFGARLRQIFRGVRRAAEAVPEAEVLVSVHPNPEVVAAAAEVFAGSARVRTTDPPPYAAWAALMSEATLVVTDSGGLQEEAPALGLPVVVAREATERPEAVAAGTAVLAGTDEEAVFAHVHALLTDAERRERMAQAPNPFGDGAAGERIAAIVERWLEAKGGLGER